LYSRRGAQRTLGQAIKRTETGGVDEASRIARDARPLVRRLDPAVDRFLSGPTTGGEIDGAAEEAMDDLIAELQQAGLPRMKKRVANRGSRSRQQRKAARHSLKPRLRRSISAGCSASARPFLARPAAGPISRSWGWPGAAGHRAPR
jgi:hypothetical protein